MPESDKQPPEGECSCPEDYLNPLDSATPSLDECIRDKIASHGNISFPKFLDLALYHPTLGYYARTDSQVGKKGDFYTSVSVGPLFGKLLARRFLDWWEGNGKPTSWRILEIGAHDGKLAVDILTTLREISSEASETLEYAISEPLPRLRKAQRERLTPIAKRLHLASSLSELSSSPLPGIAFGNEILDALPFHLVEFISEEWREVHVGIGEEGSLELSNGNHASPLCEKLGNGFPENYRTEIRTNFRAFLESVRSCLTDGLLLFIDYGFAAPEYYDTQRTTGTLRTFSKHKAAEDPLDRPGELDITAHVDFTDLARAAAQIGYFPTAFSNQGSYLTHLAKPLILSGAFEEPKTIAQFQALTHPAHLGGKFHAIELTKTGSVPPEVAHRLAL
ncbi:MAG: SAM-dependent methyltransferase [Verrucomicrobia bacterium]|nr:SAM-dependent methyltransferase [Verrucomicrobiota bacterium]